MVSPFIGRELEEEEEWLLMEGCLFKRDQVKMKGITEAVVQLCSVKKLFLEISQNPQEYTYARASFLIKLQAIHRPEISYEVCEISKNTFFHRTSLVAASGINLWIHHTLTFVKLL